MIIHPTMPEIPNGNDRSALPGQVIELVAWSLPYLPKCSSST